MTFLVSEVWAAWSSEMWGSRSQGRHRGDLEARDGILETVQNHWSSRLPITDTLFLPPQSFQPCKTTSTAVSLFFCIWFPTTPAPFIFLKQEDSPGHSVSHLNDPAKACHLVQHSPLLISCKPQTAGMPPLLC